MSPSIWADELIKELKKYDPNVKVLNHSVGELIGWHEGFSVEKCSLKAFNSLTDLGDYYQREGIPILKKYTDKCKMRLLEFCSKNLAGLQESVLDKIASKDKDLLRSFLKHLKAGSPGKLQVNFAYRQLIQPLKEKNDKFLSEESEFLSKLEGILNHFSDVNLHLVDGSKGILGKIKLPFHSSDILKAEWDTLCKVSADFPQFASNRKDRIKELLSKSSADAKSEDASDELIEQLENFSSEVSGLQGLLNKYDKNTKVYDTTVGEIIGWCDESLDVSRRREISNLVGQFPYRDTLPILKEYVNHCARESILATISPGQQNLVRSYLKHLEDKDISNLSSPLAAYHKLTEPLKKKGIFEEEKFLSELEGTMSKFDGMESFSPPMEAEISSHKVVPRSKDILINEWNRLCKVSLVFYGVAAERRKGL